MDFNFIYGGVNGVIEPIRPAFKTDSFKFEKS